MVPMNMKHSSLIALSLCAAALSIGACAAADESLVYRSTTEKSTRELIPLAAEAARARGYEVANEDDVNGHLVALNPDHTTGLLVEVRKDGIAGTRAMSCQGMGGCGTWYTITPLTTIDHKVVPWQNAPAAVTAQARELVVAIGEHAQ
jgi:hypothetical protein